jgi:multidrug efflux pump subunit AcrA (membrane-fusion protein)
MEPDPRKPENASVLDWGELEDLLAGYARLVKSDAPFSRIARELVEHLVDSLAAVGAALWISDEQAVLRLERQANLEVLGTEALTGEHRRLLEQAVRSGQPEVLSPHEGESITSAYSLILVPLVVDTDAVGLVEVIQRPTLTGDAMEGNLRFASLLAELTAEYLRRQEIRELRQVSKQSRQFEEFIHLLNSSLDSRIIVSELANEGRRYIGCDRVSVAIRHGRRYKLAAVSAVDVINRRSIAVKRLEKLVRLVAATGEEFWHEDTEQELAPQVETALTKYLDESHAGVIGIIPLRATRGHNSSVIIGALVVEGFGSHRWDPSHEMTLAVAKHGALALANSLRYRSLPTIPFLRHRHRIYGEPTHFLAKSVAAIALIAGLASTFVIETDFNLYAHGELQPARRQQVFAPLDGDVSQVSVVHGDSVKTGQTLIQMSNSELDLEIQKIQGEHDATLQRSAAIESALLDYSSSEDEELNEINQLSSEQEELAQLFASQKQRLAVLREQREKLTVQSPITGEILTWETEEELLNRPVRSGQRLMTVADLNGPWEAELRVPDDRIGPLLQLREEGREPLEAKFELATAVDVEHRGQITQISQRTEIGADNQPVVRVTVDVDKSTLVDPRPGATLNAKIYCGRRSIFYVWCHDLIERVQGWLKF